MKTELTIMQCPHLQSKQAPPSSVYPFDYWELILCPSCDRMLKGSLFDYILQKLANPLIETILETKDNE